MTGYLFIDADEAPVTITVFLLEQLFIVYLFLIGTHECYTVLFFNGNEVHERSFFLHP